MNAYIRLINRHCTDQYVFETNFEEMPIGHYRRLPLNFYRRLYLPVFSSGYIWADRTTRTLGKIGEVHPNEISRFSSFLSMLYPNSSWSYVTNTHTHTNKSALQILSMLENHVGCNSFDTVDTIDTVETFRKLVLLRLLYPNVWAQFCPDMERTFDRVQHSVSLLYDMRDKVDFILPLLDSNSHLRSHYGDEEWIDFVELLTLKGWCSLGYSLIEVPSNQSWIDRTVRVRRDMKQSPAEQLSTLFHVAYRYINRVALIQEIYKKLGKRRAYEIGEELLKKLSPAARDWIDFRDHKKSDINK